MAVTQLSASLDLFEFLAFFEREEFWEARVDKPTGYRILTSQQRRSLLGQTSAVTNRVILFVKKD